jgi:hypothetical protein
MASSAVTRCVDDRDSGRVFGVVEDGGLGHLAHAPHVVDGGQAAEEAMHAPL